MVNHEMFNLLKIGLTEGEAKVYLALSELGSSTVGPIVKKSKVAYSNIYEILNRLIEKGIVSFIIKNKTRDFQAASPSNLIQYLDKKQEQIIQEKEALEKILPDLEKLREAKSKQEAEVFIGKKGLRTAYEKLWFAKKAKHLTMRFSNLPLPGNIDIINDKILLVSWGESIFSVLIHSQSLADNLRKYFNEMWLKSNKLH